MHRMLAAFLFALVPGLANAADDKVIQVYNWNDYIAPQVLADFEKKTGIRVDYQTFSTSEELNETLASGKSFDIVVPSNDGLPALIKSGTIQPLDKSKLPNLVHLDKQMLNKLSAFDPKNKYAVPYLWGAVGLAINTPQAEAAFGGPLPKSWSVLFDPAQSAKLASCGISVLDAEVEVFTILMNYRGRALVDSAPRQVQTAGKALRAVRPNIRLVDSEQYIPQLNSGKLCVALAWVGDALAAADAGQPVEFVVPSEGSMMFIDNMVIPANAKHPELAHQFIDYIMQPEVAALITNETLYPNPNADAGPFLDENLRNLSGIAMDKATRRRLSLFPALPERVSTPVSEQWKLFRAEPGTH